MRKWRPADVPADADWTVNHCFTKTFWTEVLSLDHGHYGVTKSYHKVLNHFFWPCMKKDVCKIRQLGGKPNRKIIVRLFNLFELLKSLSVEFSFDCVAPLPESKFGNEDLLTIMCISTRFPEAIPLRNFKAKTIVKALIKFFFLLWLDFKNLFNLIKIQILCTVFFNKLCTS